MKLYCKLLYLNLHKFDTLENGRGKHRKYLPYVFTEQGVSMLSKVSIILIENYIDESILNLFSKNQNVKFTIYTQNISKDLTLDIQKYNKQYSNLKVKITKNFHDRFLICDETVYHFGASFKDLGNKIFKMK